MLFAEAVKVREKREIKQKTIFKMPEVHVKESSDNFLTDNEKAHRIEELRKMIEGK